MGSVEFDVEVEDESQPCTSDGRKCKLPRKLPDNGGAVNHASVPRKLRSDIKKRVRKSVAPNLPISRKRNHVLNGSVMLGRDGGKRCKSNKKQRKITKEEEEVAETLYAMAGMFSDPDSSEQPETKASATLEAGSSVKAVEDTGIVPPHESQKIASKFTIDVACNSSSLVDSASKVMKFQSLGDAWQPAASVASGNQSKNLDPRPSINGLPESTNSASQPLSIGNRATAGELVSVPSQVELKKLRKRCPGHVYISSLIKDLQVSEGKEELFSQPAQIANDVRLGSHVIMHNQMTETSGRNGCGSSNGINHLAVENESTKIQNDIPSHRRIIQDQQAAAETSAPCSSMHQGFDFISLGGGVSGLNPSESINRIRRGVPGPNQFHAPYVQSQSNAAMLFSPSQNGYSAAYHGQYPALSAQQVQLPPQYSFATLNSSFTARLQLDTQQQKWAAELPTQYNISGVGAMQFPDWKNGGIEPRSMLNYAHALFPRLQSALSSKYHQQFSQSQQQQQLQLMAHNSTPLHLSNVKRNQNHILPLGFERNGSAAAFYQESTPQHLQLPCNHHL